MRTNVSGRRVAFTLIELLVALTIIVALTMLCMPAIGPMMNVSSVDSGASIVRAGLMRARHSAVAQQREGFCWLAEGSVVESGVISSVVGGSAVDITMDNDDGSGITISGAWTPSSSNSARIGSNYLHDGNAGKGAKSVQYTPTITTAGSYEVSTWVIGYSGGANNTPIDITHADGTCTESYGGDWRTNTRCVVR